VAAVEEGTQKRTIRQEKAPRRRNLRHIESGEAKNVTQHRSPTFSTSMSDILVRLFIRGVSSRYMVFRKAAVRLDPFA
jgi:hypothetical protein